ncbi:MAG TPA: porin family protein [Parafilimonas sp.]|nr:porin family protein [Parafilimonas sp.]
MKKRTWKAVFTATLFATTATLLSNAQTTSDAKLNPGGIYIKGGYNAANISVSNDGAVNDAKALSTFHAGVIADIPVAPVLSFQTGLLLNGQGAKTNYYLDNNNTSDNYIKTRFNPLYLELPASLVVKFPIGSNARIYAGGGPYAAMGIGGKQKVETSIAGIVSSSTDNIKFDNDDPTTGGEEGARYDRLKKFDVGMNALAGVEVDRFMIGVNYGWGLTKINSTQADNSNDKNKYRTLSVGVGFRL